MFFISHHIVKYINVHFTRRLFTNYLIKNITLCFTLLIKIQNFAGYIFK